MKSREDNYAFIDSQNLNLGTVNKKARRMADLFVWTEGESNPSSGVISPLPAPAGPGPRFHRNMVSCRYTISKAPCGALGEIGRNRSLRTYHLELSISR